MKTTRTAATHRRPTYRTRAAVIVAALLTIVGAGLVAAPFVTATAAPSAPPTKVGVCHATTSDSNPYVWLVVSTSSTRYQGHLMHRTDPPHAWKGDGTWNGIEHRAGDGKPDYIQGLDAGLTRDWCLGLVTPTPTPTDTGTSTPTPTDTPTTTPPVDTGSPTPSTSSPAASTTAPEPGTTAPAPTTSKPGELAHTAGASTSMLLVLSGLTLVGLGALTMLATRRVGVHA